MEKSNRFLCRVIAGLLAAVMVLCVVLPTGGAALFASVCDSAAVGGVAYAGGAEPIVIDENNFPDPKFREVIATREYDRDGNGSLDASEIAQVINIHCEGKGITSLKGVEFFTALQGLWCQDNAIASMNLSNNKDLHGVWCSGNLFTDLDFSANPELEWVYCFDCKLKSLNVSNNPKMAFIECNSNPLDSLNVTNCPLLEHLTCGACGLSELNLSNNPRLAHLDAFRNNLTSLDVTGCPKMKRLDIWDNHHLGSIDISKCTGLQYYNCANNGVTSLNVSNNRELTKLICSYNSISSLNLSNNPKLFYLDCACNQIGSLDVSRNTELHFLQAFTNPFTKLDISNNRLLVKTYQDGTKKSEAAVCQGHSWTLDYGGDTSTGGDNLYFLCVDDKVTINAGSGNGGNGGGNGGAGGTVIDESDGYVVRARAAQILYEMAGKPGVSGKSRFTDVESGSWYEAAVIWGEKNAICFGTPDISSDTFKPGDRIMIQDLLLMLMRYAEYKNLKRAIDFGRSDDFADYYQVDQYAWEAVCWAATYDIYSGKGDPNAPKEERRIDPHGKATRAEMDEMIRRLKEVNSGGGATKTPTPTVKAEATKTPTPTAAAGGATATPTAAAEKTPTVAPDKTPTAVPEGTPTVAPDQTPTLAPDQTPTVAPEGTPTLASDQTPTLAPDQTPTLAPDQTPTLAPDQSPTPTAIDGDVTPTSEPGLTPTVAPEGTPTLAPENEEQNASGKGVPIGETQEQEPSSSSKTLLFALIAVVGVLAAVTVVFVVLKRRKAAEAAKEAGSGKEETGGNEQ